MKNNNLITILVATVFGLLAGAAGALFSGFYLGVNDSSLAFSRELNLSGYGALSSNLVIRDPKKVVVNQDVKTDETIRDLRASLLGVFVKKTDKNAYYELANPFSQALAATSDGWVMAAWPKNFQKTDIEKIITDFVVIDSSRKTYKIDKVLADQEKIGAFIFLHLQNASGLNVRRLIPDAEINTGQSVLLSAGRGSFFLNALSSKKASETVLSSDIYSQELSLAYGEEARPSFVFNLSGDIIAAVDWQGKWLVSPALDSYWRSLLKTASLRGPYLGVNYLDLSAITGDDNLPAKGARLQSNGSGSAVLKNSPAEKAGLKSGDIITRFNGVEINTSNNLSVLLAAYSPGDSVDITYSRNGVSTDIELELSSY
jgi:hypothetical protein